MADPDPADPRRMTAAEAAELLKAIAALTLACQAFATTAERMYPHLKLDLRLPWQIARDTERGEHSGPEPIC